MEEEEREEEEEKEEEGKEEEEREEVAEVAQLVGLASLPQCHTGDLPLRAIAPLLFLLLHCPVELIRQSM